MGLSELVEEAVLTLVVKAYMRQDLQACWSFSCTTCTFYVNEDDCSLPALVGICGWRLTAFRPQTSI